MTVLLTNGRKSLKESVREVLDAFQSDIDWTRGVFLKPNIVSAVKPSTGEITSPAVVRALVEAIRERHEGIDLVVGEGVAAGRDAAENFRVSGFARLATELDVPLIDLHDDVDRVPVAWEFGTLELPCIALERVYINVPILKYSSACIISGAMKNQKGLLLPEVKKRFHHLGLHRPIAELNAAVMPALTVLDCSRFLGQDVLLSGGNCGEIDATACQLLGIDEPEHVALARIAGVFTDGFALWGDPGSVRRTAARPEAKEYRRVGRLRLWSNSRACTGCRAVFEDARHDVLKPHHFGAKARLMKYCVSGADIVMGSEPAWHRGHTQVICVGSCARRLAEESGYLHIPGCPPTLEDFYRHLT